MFRSAQHDNRNVTASTGEPRSNRAFNLRLPQRFTKTAIMAMMHVNRGATSLGVFSEEQIREGLRTGRFASSDIAWREGMPNWQPLSQFAEFAGVASDAPPLQSGTTVPAAAPRSGLPWEHRQDRGFFNAFVETLVMVLTKPGTAFAVMRTEGGLGEPLLYAIIGGGAGVIVWFIFSLILNSLGFLNPRETSFGPMVGMSVSFVMLVWRLVAVAIAPFIFGGLVHLALIVVGGANKAFETTFRVISFSQGSTAPLQLVPCCGGLVALVWCLVANCIGVARAHEIDTGRATLAVLLPVIVCCGGGMLLLFMFGGLALLQHNSSH